jgi:Ran GTPase-activating protein (RanGAP) involved in mRNA processing and transport
MCNVLKPDPANPNAANKNLKVLDISYNPITGRAFKAIADMMETNRTLEYLGLGKNHMENEHLIPILNSIGRLPFPSD